MLTVSRLFSGVPPLFASLAKVISGDIDCSHLGIKSHSVDGSPYMVRPQAVVYPKTSTDIKHVIAFAREYNLPITVCGGGTAKSGGSLGEGVVLDMTRHFSHVRHVNMMEHTVTVDAGVRIDDLREKLSGWNMELPLLEEENSRATIGGLLATKSATPGSFYYGTIREWVEGLTVVVDTGEEHHLKEAVTPSGRLLGIYQAIFPLLSEHGPVLRAARREQSDDATGYSLWGTSIGPKQLIDQLVGSEGTLAVITSVTLRVMPQRKHVTALVVPVQDRKYLQTYADVAKHHRAEKLFIFDSTFRKLCNTFHPGTLPSSLTEEPFFLLVEMKHNDVEALHSQSSTFMKAMQGLGATPLVIDESNAAKIWNHGLLHSFFKDYSRGAYMVATAGEGIIVSPHEYADAIKKIDDFLSPSGRVYTITGYVGSGHIAVTTAFDTNSLSYEYDLQEYGEKLFSIVQTFKGGISAVSGDGLERTYALPYVYNEQARNVFKKFKEAWDPMNIFNPSKKISFSREYLIKHTARTLE